MAQKYVRPLLTLVLFVSFGSYQANRDLVATRLVAIVAFWGSQSHIYLMNEDSSNIRRLTTLNGDEFHPSWSPDGTQLAFEFRGHSEPGVYIVDVDGKNLRRLRGSINNHSPTWSPDGKYIAVSSWYPEFDSMDICILDVADFKDRCLTYPDRASPHHYYAPRWSPDGKFITLMTNDGLLSFIHVMQIDGSNIRSLNVKAYGFSYSWSPDGKQIAFTSLLDGHQQIYVIDADGRNLRNLSNNTRHDWFLSWSPDGKQIVFQTDRDWQCGIFIMKNDGTEPRCLAPFYELGVWVWQPEIPGKSSTTFQEF